LTISTRFISFWLGETQEKLGEEICNFVKQFGMRGGEIIEQLNLPAEAKGLVEIAKDINNKLKI
tara:strand:+ start:263 stop:454 length:192 start_codon:yes stop_codon:yes gene_type:complete